MSESKLSRKKEDKKYFGIMMIVFVLAAVAGFGSARLMDKLTENGVPRISNEFIEVMSYVLPGIFAGINIILAIIAIIFISKAKKELKKWDGEDEEVADEIDGKLGLPLSMSSIVMILDYFLFAACAHLDVLAEEREPLPKLYFIIVIAIFLVAFIIIMIVQKNCVDLTKDMNPEKKGSVYDTNFSKKWEESCDEAQKLIIYKASSIAYKVMNSICSVMWIICLTLDLFFNIGIMPVVVVTVIWLAGVIAYLVAAGKLEKQPIRM